MRTCTIVTRSYVPFARVLATSFLNKHPSGTLTALVFDAEVGEIEGEPFEVWTPDDLRLSPSEFRRMAMIYNALEFSTALKPFLLERLLDGSDQPVTYFDADIQVFAPLGDIDHRARDSEIVLTPHLLSPITRDGQLPSEASILKAGVYNLGFLALGRNHAMLPWWQDRLRRHCLADSDDESFVDQRWIDFVPGLWDHWILRDAGCNVAYWNVDQRTVAHDGAGYTVDGHALRFFHFSGYSPDRPDELSRYQTRTTLRDHPTLARLCDDYGRRLLDAGFDEFRDVPYRYGATGGGTPIDTTARRAARSALLAHETGGSDVPPPDPFDRANGDHFVDFMRSPAPGGRVSRYLDALWRRRPDLQMAFPDPGGADADGYEEWADIEGRHQDGVSPDYL